MAEPSKRGRGRPPGALNRLRQVVHEATPPPPVIPSLDNLDSVQLPPVADGHWQSVDALPDAPEPRAARPLVVERSTGFQALLDTSIDEANHLVSIPWESLPDYLCRVKASLIQSALTNGARVDENTLRKQQLDLMPKLLELISKEEKKLPLLIHQPPAG